MVDDVSRIVAAACIATNCFSMANVFMSRRLPKLLKAVFVLGVMVFNAWILAWVLS